jgi:3-oxoacyl-[acyl-carrier protein] reductase
LTPFSLKGKSALVTGAGKGIGRACALALARAGADLALVGRTRQTLESASREAQDRGAKTLVLEADLGDAEAPARLVAEAVEKLGGLHILVNNAGQTKDGLVMRMSDQDWDRVLAINLTGPFRMIRAACRPMMKQRWGRIINMASVVALMGNPGQANYVASKAGLIGLTKAVAKELGSRNITVNALAPGFIETDMTAGLPPAAVEAYKKAIPLEAFGTPEQVAGAVVFLASEEAAYITGQVLGVDGGLRMS